MGVRVAMESLPGEKDSEASGKQLKTRSIKSILLDLETESPSFQKCKTYNASELLQLHSPSDETAMLLTQKADKKEDFCVTSNPSACSKLLMEVQETFEGETTSKEANKCTSKKVEGMSMVNTSEKCQKAHSLNSELKRVVVENCNPIEMYKNCNRAPANKGKQLPVEVKKCLNCGMTKTSIWRDGPMGQKTLCNTCHLRYVNKGRLHPTCGVLRPAGYPLLHTHEPDKEKVLKKSISFANKRATSGNRCDKSGNQSLKVVQECLHCKSTETPQWREGPEGPHTLCNACGLHYIAIGKLDPEYCPKTSPIYNPSLHSHSKKGVMKKRMCNAKKDGTSGNSEDSPPSPSIRSEDT